MTAGTAPSFARLVRAPNPGPMTLEGTNTWVLRAGADGPVVVVDPGPADDAHLEAVCAHGPVALVVLTHGHLDHAEAVEPLRRLTGAPVAAADPALCHDADPLRDGASLDAGGVALRVLAAPGHTADSAVLVASAAGGTAVLTGDTVLGRGSTVVAHPDGRLTDYLATLHRLRALGPLTVLPGHGPVRPDLAAAAAELLAHRAERLAQVRDALASGAETVEDVVRAVYADVLDADPRLRRATEMSVRAQLEHLAEQDG